ncbi:hypothetical protein BDF21DRAFT_496182 [Thamnidium elegans]|nr:hypothetical protein BDF21DRAFT_496182 [Thamnidium elegans]
MISLENMKQKNDKKITINALEYGLKPDRPRARAHFNQETDGSKESLKCVLYTPEKAESSLSEITKNENGDSTDSLKSFYESVQNRHCSICNTTFRYVTSFLDHELHCYKSKKIPIVDLENLCCNICNKTFKCRTKYRIHMANLNGIYIPVRKQNTKTKVDPLKTPDIDDPNNYCNSCDYMFMYRKPYLQHLLIKHNIHFKQPEKVGNTAPTFDILNLYCNVCNKTFDTKSVYVHHFVQIHGMTLPDSYSELSNFDINNLYCKVCDFRYKNKHSFMVHLRNLHYVELPSHFDVAPDVNDPDHFCITCDKLYGSRMKYLYHLTDVHHDMIPELYQGTDCMHPNVKDIGYKRYCSDCRKVFLSKHLFLIHLDKMHATGPKTLPSVNKEDITNPSNHFTSCNKTSVADVVSRYCNICDRTYSSLEFYQFHMTRNHHVQFPSSNKLPYTVNRDKKPVIDDTGSHCTACNKVYKNRLSYKTHVYRIHGMSLNGDKYKSRSSRALT